MKEINDQLYGYSYELDTTSESDGTKCFAVDTGTVFVAYKGAWYEQPGSLWAASISPSDDDILGLSYEVNKTTPASDLTVFNAVDTGARYVSFQGRWYKQPVQWSAPASGGGGGGGGGGGSDSGVTTVTITFGVATSVGTMNKTWQEISDAVEDSIVLLAMPNPNANGVIFGGYVEAVKSDGYSVDVVTNFYTTGSSRSMVFRAYSFTAESPDGYPTCDLS